MQRIYKIFNVQRSKATSTQEGGENMVSKAKATATKTKNRTTSILKRVSGKLASSTEFALTVPEAKEVFLVGDFNNWNGSDSRMQKFKDGVCKKKIKLKPGRYEYRFIVDGNWMTDPENPNRQANEFGTENSVITIS